MHKSRVKCHGIGPPCDLQCCQFLSGKRVLSSEFGLRVMEEEDDVSTYSNDWGYGYYDEEPKQECVEQPYFDSMYQVCLGFPEPVPTV